MRYYSLLNEDYVRFRDISQQSWELLVIAQLNEAKVKNGTGLL
jgi:hypothetical protein